MRAKISFNFHIKVLTECLQYAAIVQSQTAEYLRLFIISYNISARNLCIRGGDGQFCIYYGS